MKASKKEQRRECLCSKENVRNGRNFKKIVDLEDSGLVIYHHEDRIGNESAGAETEAHESSKMPADDVFIVHNMSEVEIKPADLVQQLDINKITCRRCRKIYEHAQKLLQKIPILNKNVTGICTHCYLKAQPVGPCRKCADIVKKFVATKGENVENKLRDNTWLSKVNHLLDDILVDEKPKNLKSRAHLEVYINDLQETPSQTTCDKSEVKRIIKSALRDQTRAQSEIYFHDLLGTPSRTTFDRSEVKRPFKSQMHLSDTDITASVSNIWNEMKSDIKPEKTLDFRKGKFPELWKEQPRDMRKEKYFYEDKDQHLGMKKDQYQDINRDQLLGMQKENSQCVNRDQPLGMKKEKYQDVNKDRPLGMKAEKPQERLESRPTVKKDKFLHVKKEKSVEAKSSNWKVEKYSMRYMQDKYDIRTFDEKPTQRKKYCVAKYLHGKSSKHTPSDHLRLDKKIHFSKQTVDDSKHESISKPFKQPNKFKSDETMITTISKATKKSSKKDLVYFFPKDITKKQLQPKSYVSSSTLIMETRDKFKGDEDHKKLNFDDDKKKVGEGTKIASDLSIKERMVIIEGVDHKRNIDYKNDLAKTTNKKLNSPISTVTTKSKADRGRTEQDEKSKEQGEKRKEQGEKKKEQDEKQRKMEQMMKDIEEQKSKPAKKSEVEFATTINLSQKPSKKIIKDPDDKDDKNKDKDEEARKLQKMRELQREQEFKAKKDQKVKDKADASEVKEVKDPRKMELDMNQIKPCNTPGDDALILKMTNDVKKDIGPIPTIGSDIIKALRLNDQAFDDPYLSSNTDLIILNETGELVLGETILKYKPLVFDKISEPKNVPSLFQTFFDGESTIGDVPVNDDVVTREKKPPRASTEPKGIIRYALSDRTFIENGWTKLPTEKIVRRMNVYRMRPAHPELDWFEKNKNKELIQYDSGEKLATFDENGRGQWFYKNGGLALDYYDAEEMNAQQRFVVYSSGEPDERGRKYPITVLAAFDYLGNGVVFDHTGKIRLKYNQTEGVVLDRGIGPVSHWKWHALNDPPVLQQVMIDTETPNKDPLISKLGMPTDNLPRTDNEEMLAIEFENFVKEKEKKLAQEYKPFQIKMKALKINENFSLRILDQATVYLIFRDGLTTFKLNLGMLLDHHEIVDTDTADLGDVTNHVERLPARTDSLAGLRRRVTYAQRHERARTERERKLRVPDASADRLTAGASPSLRCQFRTLSEKCYCNRKPSTQNLYYDTRII